MTPEQKKNVENWIAALKSGEYVQGRGVLKSLANTHCCLGVLCEVQNLSRNAENKFVFDEHYASAYILQEEWFNDVTGFITDSNKTRPDVIDDLIAINDRSNNFDDVVFYLERKLNNE